MRDQKKGKGKRGKGDRKSRKKERKRERERERERGTIGPQHERIREKVLVVSPKLKICTLNTNPHAFLFIIFVKGQRVGNVDHYIREVDYFFDDSHMGSPTKGTQFNRVVQAIMKPCHLPRCC